MPGAPEAGGVRLAYGCSRLVILTRRYAIKVPNFRYGWRAFLHGLLHNMQERAFARTKHPKLCPVVCGVPGGWLIVMRRATPLASSTPDGEWLAVWCREDPTLWIPAEPKTDSFGWLDGRLVAVDYGDA